MNYVRTGTVLLRVNTGAPTWWRPRASLAHKGKRLWHLRLGWLRACIEIGFQTRRYVEADDA